MMNEKKFLCKIYPLDKNIKKEWFVSYKVNGRKLKKYGRLAHCTTLDEKLKEAKRIIRELNKPVTTQLRRNRDIIQNLSEVLEYRKPGLELKSYQTYFSKLKIFAEWYRPAYQVNKSISPVDFIRHLQVQKKSNNTIRKYVTMLKDFFNELIRLGKYNHQPFEFIKIKKVKSKSLLPFHPAQVAEIKPFIVKEDPQLWEAIQFEYYLYFRPKEIRLLKISDIIFEDMKIILSNDIAKDDDNYLKSIPVPMQTMITKYKGYPGHYFIFSKNGLPGPHKLSTNDLSSRHRKYLRQLNYNTRYAFYSWVHTGIKMAAMAGIPMKQLQLQKGHSDLKMFDEYLKDLGVDDCQALKNNFPEL